MDGKAGKNTLSLTRAQQEKINSLIQEEKTVRTSGNQTTITLSDEQLYNILKQTLTANQLENVQAAKHHKGVSKIVFFWQKK